MKICPPSDEGTPNSDGPSQRREKAFGSQARLRTRSQLDYVKRHGRTKAGPLCVVSTVIPPPDGNRRAVFIISRRFSTKAVIRNRARRLLRETYRLLFPELTAAWVVLIPRARLQGARLADVLADVQHSCHYLGLIPAPEEAGVCG